LSPHLYFVTALALQVDLQCNDSKVSYQKSDSGSTVPSATIIEPTWLYF